MPPNKQGIICNYTTIKWTQYFQLFFGCHPSGISISSSFSTWMPVSQVCKHQIHTFKYINMEKTPIWWVFILFLHQFCANSRLKWTWLQGKLYLVWWRSWTCRRSRSVSSCNSLHLLCPRPAAGPWPAGRWTARTPAGCPSRRGGSRPAGGAGWRRRQSLWGIKEIHNHCFLLHICFEVT